MPLKLLPPSSGVSRARTNVAECRARRLARVVRSYPRNYFAAIGECGPAAFAERNLVTDQERVAGANLQIPLYRYLSTSS